MTTQPVDERRTFLRLAASSVGITLCAGTVAGLLSSCETTERSDTAGPGLPPVPFLLDGITELETVGGITTQFVSGINNNNVVFIARVSETDFVVFSNVCTHQGCPVSLPDDIGGNVRCPCHGAEYAWNSGKNVKQPLGGGRATDLPKFASTYDAQTKILMITP